MPPLLQALRVDGLPHLLGARGAHGAIGLVKVHTGALERQLAIVQDAPHLALEVGDHVLVLDVQDAAWQGGVPVRHQFNVGPVVAADLLQPVREFLAFGEQLLEVAETAGHRLAARIDDLRVGQDQVDQAEVDASPILQYGEIIADANGGGADDRAD